MGAALLWGAVLIGNWPVCGMSLGPAEPAGQPGPGPAVLAGATKGGARGVGTVHGRRSIPSFCMLRTLQALATGATLGAGQLARHHCEAFGAVRGNGPHLYPELAWSLQENQGMFQ